MTKYDRNITLYHYDASPFGRKVVWYLTLRGIPYNEVKQPMIMPRPDVKALGVAYRRIPLMAIGKDIYCDTRIILRKLEEFFPHGKIGVGSPEGRALQRLLDVWHNEAGLFGRAAQTLPAQLLNESFAKDRKDMTGISFDRKTLEKLKPDALVYLRSAFSFFEDLLSDGRDWLLDTTEPSLGDIEGIFTIDWLVNLRGALPELVFSKNTFPRVYAWDKRFRHAVRVARDKGPKAKLLKGAEAVEHIKAAEFAEEERDVDPASSQSNLQKGDRVEVFPTDSGSSHRERGLLLCLTGDEIVISLENGLRLHTPRIGFRVRRVVSKL